MSDETIKKEPVTPLEKARWCYQALRGGLGTPSEHVAYIRKQLARDGLEVEQLDETGQKTREAIEAELADAVKHESGNRRRSR